MTVRLKDVAAHAGVSVKTVSNVVREYPHVSHDLRARVQASLDELGYRPHAHARSLRTGRTGTIGLAVPRLRDAYFAEVADHVVTAAGRRGWTVLVEQTGEDPRREAEVLAGLRPTVVDGLIFSPLALERRAMDEAVAGLPLVLLGEHLHDAGRARVALDNVTAVRDAVLHLAATGCTRIAAVGAQSGVRAATAAVRMAGYRAGLAEAGLDPGGVGDAAPGDAAPGSSAAASAAPGRVSYDARYEAVVGSYQRQDGADATRSLLRRRPRPDALLCFNDLLALGALRALHEAGVRVPDDIAVVGIDDITEASFCVPSLTTVALDRGRLADEAVALLARRIDAPAAPEPAAVVVPHRLVVRESTRPLQPYRPTGQPSRPG